MGRRTHTNKKQLSRSITRTCKHKNHTHTSTTNKPCNNFVTFPNIVARTQNTTWDSTPLVLYYIRLVPILFANSCMCGHLQSFACSNRWQCCIEFTCLWTICNSWLNNSCLVVRNIYFKPTHKYPLPPTEITTRLSSPPTKNGHPHNPTHN